MYSYEDICRKTGIYKTTLKKITIEILEKKSENNAKKEFTKEEYLKLLEIIFYKKLKCSKGEIQEKIKNSDYIIIKDYDKKINELTKQRDDLNKTIRNLKLIRKLKIEPSSFFTDEYYEIYEESEIFSDKSGIFCAIDLMSNPEIFNLYIKYFKMKEKEGQKFKKYLDNVIEAYHKGYKYENEDVQKMFLKLFRYFNNYIIPFCLSIKPLIYVLNSESKEYSDEEVKYILDVEAYFIKNNKTYMKYDDFVDQFFYLIFEMVELGLYGHKKDEEYVLNLVSELIHFIRINNGQFPKVTLFR